MLGLGSRQGKSQSQDKTRQPQDKKRKETTIRSQERHDTNNRKTDKTRQSDDERQDKPIIV